MAETGVRIMNSETPTLEAREETMVRAGLRISVFCLAQLSVLVTKRDFPQRPTASKPQGSFSFVRTAAPPF